MDQGQGRGLRNLTRRHFFGQCGLGLGAMALGSLVADGRPARGASALDADPLAPRPGHFPARARSVIYLFMAGGPSQFELFEHKPKLQDYSNQSIPDSFIAGRRFAFMSGDVLNLGYASAAFADANAGTHNAVTVSGIATSGADAGNYTANTTATTTTRASNANDWTPDHAVMSGNKEQLKALPQFKYSDYN